MLDKDLLKTARFLIPKSGKPSQVRLKRAVSTAYYAIFHAMARNAADMLVGSTSANRSLRAWLQVYRALDHTHAKNQCNQRTINLFPNDIQKLASKFVHLQAKRHEADYNPYAFFTKSEVIQEINEAEQVIKSFSHTANKDKRAFAVYVLMKIRS